MTINRLSHCVSVAAPRLICSFIVTGSKAYCLHVGVVHILDELFKAVRNASI